MNKTIINGIDVSECYANKKMMKDGLYCFWEGGSCTDNKFCYFKQLKRLQEENEELKQVRKNSPDIQEPYVYLYRKIKKQCHKLEEENGELKICFTSTDINAKRIQAKLFDKEEECKKYKQALEEIKEIADKLITGLPEYHSCYYKDECGDNCTPKKQSKVEYCCYENVDKILATINEVLNDRD